MGFKTYGIVGVIAFGAYGVSEADKSLNYVEATAKITHLSTECTVEARKKRLVHKDSGELAYMDCKLAKLIAPAKGYSEDNIKYHYELEYSYKSPVDNQWHTDKGTRTSSKAEKYKAGQEFLVLAHTRKANKTRWK